MPPWIADRPRRRRVGFRLSFFPFLYFFELTAEGFGRVWGKNGFQAFSPSDRTRVYEAGPVRVCIQQKKNGRATRAGPRCWTSRRWAAPASLEESSCCCAPPPSADDSPLTQRLMRPLIQLLVLVSLARKRDYGAGHRSGMFSRAELKQES
jgi:hypothetical protein